MQIVGTAMLLASEDPSILWKRIGFSCAFHEHCFVLALEKFSKLA
jgi:hypothetical protein